jgi:Ca2+-binding EF-hand superfamily protein
MKARRGPILLLLGWIALASQLARGAEIAKHSPSGSPHAPDVQDLIFLGPLRPLVIRLHVTIDGQPFRQVWQERFDELFALEDRDHDGRVTLEQAGAIARDMNGSLRDAPAGDFRDVAAADGTVDRATLLDALAKILPPFSVHRRPVIARGSALALFPLLDTDHNHQLSAAELAAAETQLQPRDFDDDRVITGPELILDPNAIAAASDPASAQPDLDPNESPVLPVEPLTTPAQIAEKLLKHYDRNHDGRLTAVVPEIEIRLPAAAMARLDVNGDGALDHEELESFVGGHPDLELVFAMGHATAPDRRSRQRGSTEREFRVRQKLNGGYELQLGEANIEFNRNNRDPRQTDLVEFRTYDRDNNGYIDTAEAAANNIGKSAFAAMDVDGDGKVFKGELTSFMTRQNAAAAFRLQLEIRDLGQDLFDMLDTDKDGVLSPRELRDAKNLLVTEDKNGDGALNGDEVPQRLEFELLRGADDRSDTDTRMVRRPARQATKASTSGPLWFRKMDRNNDGDLSPHEFVGPLSAFEKLDANHDGLVDREEAEAAEKK